MTMIRHLVLFLYESLNDSLAGTRSTSSYSSRITTTQLGSYQRTNTSLYHPETSSSSLRNAYSSTSSAPTVFRNMPQTASSLSAVMRSKMDSQFASDVKFQRSVNNCIRANEEITRKARFIDRVSGTKMDTELFK